MPAGSSASEPTAGNAAGAPTHPEDQLIATSERKPSDSARRTLVEHQIIDSAARLFSEQGFGATTLQHIADRVGISRPAVYHYFASKEDILVGLFRLVGQRFSEAVSEIADRPGASAADRLRAMTVVAVETASSQPDRFRALQHNSHHLPEKMAHASRSSGRKIVEAFERVLEEGVAAGEFRPVDTYMAAENIIGMANWTAWWLPTEQARAVAARDLLVDMAVRSVANDHRDGRDSDPLSSLQVIRDEIARMERHLRR